MYLSFEEDYGKTVEITYYEEHFKSITIKNVHTIRLNQELIWGDTLVTNARISTYDKDTDTTVRHIEDIKIK